jgi:hypothetical protein
MTTVFANPQVAHVWAQQNQSEGRSSNGNFWFRDTTIFSYRTPLARMYFRKGLKVALIGVESYSPTTAARHLPAIHRAVDYGRGDYRAFRVPFIGTYGGMRNREPEEIDHVANLAHLEARYGAYIDQQSASRSKFRAEGLDLLKELIAIANHAIEYARLFDLSPASFDVTADTARIEAAREEALTPEAQARRAADRKRAAERKAKLKAETVAKWREGQGFGLSGDTALDDNGGALLRVKDGELQTSLGARVPLDHAVKVFRFVKLCRERGVSWERNGKVIRVGHFTVDRIEANGDFRAGCHRINWPEVENAARLADVLDTSADDSALEVHQ